MEYIKIDNYLEVTQPVGTFYVAKITPKQLKRISNDNLSRYNDIENGIQRSLSKERQKEIKEYIYNNPDATFPSTFIIAVSEDAKVEGGAIFIPDRMNEAHILDGQHRLSGFDVNDEDFQIIVSIFINIQKFDQAMIFATINGKQTKVDKSLVYDLFELSFDRSYEKIAHDIVKLLNENETSIAWYKKIKMLGKKMGDDEILSQSAMVQSYINLFKTGVLKGFYDKEEDGVIYKVLENYFNAVNEVFNQEWGNKDYILSKTTGFNALMLFFTDLYKIAESKGVPLTRDFFKYYFENIKSLKILKELTSDNYISGSVGKTNLYNDLKTCLLKVLPNQQ